MSLHPAPTGTVHKRALRLFVNAGLDFPLCAANARLLDYDKGRWRTSNLDTEVTCKRCRASRRAGRS